MNPLITLTTDFGSSDTFVAVMKGVMLSICPAARFIDLTHDIPPHDVMAGAIALESACEYFPAGAIHLAVVDPGVGADRAALAIETGRAIFVGPDNGLFSLVLQRASLKRAVALTNERWHRQPVSATFHGRDIFAPVAAHLANGASFDELGDPVDDLTTLMTPTPIISNTRIEAHVMSIDRFGNLVTDLIAEDLSNWLRRRSALEPIAASSPSRALETEVVIRIGGQEIRGLRRTFADVNAGEPIAYIGSGGRIEIAVNSGSAAEFLEAEIGDALGIEMAGTSSRRRTPS